MSESSKDTSKSLKFSPPRSLMNLEDAEEIWTIITKRYPKAAPLLCEMETVLDHAENLLEQLKSPGDLGIVLSTEESLDLNLNESEETISESANLCEYSLSKSIECDFPSVLETEESNFDYLSPTESVLIAEKNNEAIFIAEDSKTVSTSCCSTYAMVGTDSFFDEVPENTKEYLKKTNPCHLESSIQNVVTKTGLINNPTQAINLTLKENKCCSSSASENLASMKNVKKGIPILKGSPRKFVNQSEEEILHFKKVAVTLKCKEESNEMSKGTEMSKNNKEPQKKLDELAGIIRKVTESASLDGWDSVVGNSPKINENLPLVDILKLNYIANDTRDENKSPDRLTKKRDIVSPKSTKIPQVLETNNKIHSKEESQQRKRKQTQDQECGDISTLPVHESSVVILEQYAKICKKPVDYQIKDDRKGKIEITCNFAKYKVSSCGKTQDVVKNEAAARMLHMLATSQMEENIAGDLQEFSRQQILQIMKLDKGDSFIPISAKRITMVKLYTLCLEQNLLEPQYDVTPDKQNGFSSTCKVLDYVGRGTGRLEGNAKEKAAEDLYKRYSQKLKYESKGH